jgi:cell division protein FtsI/penicillin-binding protein 2
MNGRRPPKGGNRIRLTGPLCPSNGTGRTRSAAAGPAQPGGSRAGPNAVFKKRLTTFWILLLASATVLILRLADIQIVHAEQYEELAARLLSRPVRYPRAPRGSILDRNGRLLVSDEPAFDICVHYAILTGQSQAYLHALARQLRKLGEYPQEADLEEIVSHLRLRIADMWQELSRLSGRPVSDFVERGERIRQQVAQIRAAVARRTGREQPVAEEKTFHPVLENADNQMALAVRLRLGDLPWMAIMPGAVRVAHNADAVVHLIGRVGPVGPEHLEEDPLSGDELRELRPGETCGISGVERLAETILRGTRGRIVEDLDGTQLERKSPVAGSDVSLTIDLELQEYALQCVASAVESCAYPSGGAAVVIDVATREVLALVSYPVYPANAGREVLEQLRRDAARAPLRFRAVAGTYPPGSTCKAITLVAALAEGLTSAQERIHCTGHLLPDQPNVFRCWIYKEYGTTHDAIVPEGLDAEQAVCHSCNIYFYKMGGRLGPQRLCEWFDRFGLGRSAGTGLIEEARGTVPTASWLRRTRGRDFQPSDAWNWATGQGEVAATPLQAANVAATIASGFWAPVRLLRDELPSAAAQAVEPVSGKLPEPPLRVVRAGMWRVVNDPGGTAFKYARLSRHDYVLCGKTGSAQAEATPTAYWYTFEWPDGRRERVRAYLEEDALATFDEPRPRCVGRRVAEKYPALEEGQSPPAHAWFIGYTQRADTPPGAAPTGRVYAIAVLVEFGGSGGRVAGPVARQIAEWLLDH